MTDFTEDLSAMHDENLEIFGRDVTYTPRAGGPSTVRGILDQGVQPEESAPGVYATLFVKASAFSSPPVPREKITVDSRTYIIVNIDADGADGLRLLLRFDRSVV